MTRCFTRPVSAPQLTSVTSNRCPRASCRPRPSPGRRCWRPSCSTGCGRSCQAVGELGVRERVLVSASLTRAAVGAHPPSYAGDVRSGARLACPGGCRCAGGRAGARGPVGGHPAGRGSIGRQPYAAPVGAVLVLPVLSGPRPDRPGSHQGRGPAGGGPGRRPPSAWTGTRPWSSRPTPTPAAQALRTAAVVWLLLHNALRVDEVCAADIADLGEDSGHRGAARGASLPTWHDSIAAWSAQSPPELRKGLRGPPCATRSVPGVTAGR